MSQKKTSENYLEVSISEIDPPPEPDRLTISPEAVNELAQSIQAVGLLQPILLTAKDGRYEIVFGHRRFLACLQVGMGRIPARIVEYTPEQVMVARASENLQREDLTPIEEAKIYVRLTQQLGMSLEKAGQMTGKSAGVVKRRMDFLRMPESIQKALHQRKISISVAEELWACPDAVYQDYLLEMAVEHGVTKEVARMWVDDFKKSLRTKQQAGAGGGGTLSIFETPPIFVSCDTCRGPAEITEVKHLRICLTCYQTIVENLRK